MGQVTYGKDRALKRGEVRSLPTHLQTPALLYRPGQALANIRAFQSAMPSVEPYYAIKSNPNPYLIEEALGGDAGFEIASVEELRLLIQRGIPGDRILYSNPIKRSRDIEEAARAGVSLFSVDSEAEIVKLSGLQQLGAKGIIRLVVSNDESDWPLSKKFGVSLAEASALLNYAAYWKVPIVGVSFHVGSQNRTKAPWGRAIREALLLRPAFIKHGHQFEVLNIGGGFPVQHTRPIATIEEIGADIEATIADVVPESIRVVAEPGRYITGSTADLLTRVVGTAMRGGERWVTLDAGVFHGLAEAPGGLDYNFEFYRCGEALLVDSEATFCGPTCDSVDTMFHQKGCPSIIGEGDLVVIKDAGAYTSVYGTQFNGFKSPQHIMGGYVET